MFASGWDCRDTVLVQREPEASGPSGAAVLPFARITGDRTTHTIVEAGAGERGGYLVVLDLLSDEWQYRSTAILRRSCAPTACSAPTPRSRRAHRGFPVPSARALSRCGDLRRRAAGRARALLDAVQEAAGVMRSLALPLGVFLVCCGVFTAARGPGRIDMIDGQYRFEVAKTSSTTVRRRSATWRFRRRRHRRTARRYSPYGSPDPSCCRSRCVLVARALGAPRSIAISSSSHSRPRCSAQRSRRSCCLLPRLGIPPRQALAWTAVAAFATLMFQRRDHRVRSDPARLLHPRRLLVAFEGARRDSSSD